MAHVRTDPRAPAVNTLLVAGGPGTRWGDHLGVPKHLAPIMGVPLLHRLVTQFAPHGPVTIVAPNGEHRYTHEHAATVHVTPRANDAHKFISSQHLWHDRTVIVFADVYLTRLAAATITTAPDTLTFFGRHGASQYTGTPYGELFALNIPAHEHDRVKQALRDIDTWHSQGLITRSAGWELYRRLNGAGPDTVRKHRRMTGPCTFTEIDDWTDDFDYPEDYDRWITRRQAAHLPV